LTGLLKAVFKKRGKGWLVGLRPQSTSPFSSWTISDLGEFYSENRVNLVSFARKIVIGHAQSEEIVQEAFIKVVLASPKLESIEHAKAYLYQTVKNLCLDFVRAEGRRPNLMLIDDASIDANPSLHVNEDYVEIMNAAEDAAIVKQALSMLSQAERRALVLWEIEGRSTKEIATELGIKESSVRHTLNRARASLRKILANMVIDEVKGITAIDLLSTTYRKAAKYAEKSGKVALSFIILATAFLGFNSLTGSENINTILNPPLIKSDSLVTPQVEKNFDLGKFESRVISGQNTDSEQTTDSKVSMAETDLEFLIAQLDTAGAMLEAMTLIEVKE